MVYQCEKNIIMKKGSKSGLLKPFGPILGFYTKNGPRQEFLMITLWNQKSRNARIPLVSYFLAVIGAREICVSTIVVLGYDRFRKQSRIVVYVVGSLKPSSSFSYVRLLYRLFKMSISLSISNPKPLNC